MKVLHFVSSLTQSSGVMSVIMNYYRRMDRGIIQFDFLCFIHCENSYEEEIKELGGTVTYLSKPGSSLSSIRELSRFLAQHGKEYTWLHNHEVYLTFLLKPLAKRSKIFGFIIHCHATRYSDKLLSSIRNGILCIPIRFMKSDKTMLVERFACSEAAAKFLYGERLVKKGNILILQNAIDCEKYRFDPAKRKKLRKEMGLSGKYVIGHVGRFEKQKNHEFLIQVFAECKKRQENSILLLIGEGSLQPKMKELVKELGLMTSVRFLGQRNDMADLYQGMDVLVLPSRYEGLPISCVEAQINGLECIISNLITDELVRNIKGAKITMLPLKISAWEDCILRHSIRQDSNLSHMSYDSYDINLQSQRLLSFYTGRNLCVSRY